MPYPPEKYREKIEVQSDGCWLWNGHLDFAGYGVVNTGKREFAHRKIWELLIGTPPQVLHHKPTCPKNCVNPDHLSPTTHAEHPDSAPSWQKAKTHCPHGHPLDGVVHRSNGLTQRYCKTCHKKAEAIRQKIRRGGGHH